MHIEVTLGTVSAKNIGQEQAVSFIWVDVIIDVMDVQGPRIHTVSHV